VNRRREGREIAFRAVYQADVTGEPAGRCLGEIVEDVDPSQDVREFAASLVRTLDDHWP
jgi:transcription termination factor NusB